MSTHRNEEIQARLTINGLPSMDKQDRKNLSLWFENQAEAILNDDPQTYDERYEAKLIKTY